MNIASLLDGRGEGGAGTFQQDFLPMNTDDSSFLRHLKMLDLFRYFTKSELEECVNICIQSN